METSQQHIKKLEGAYVNRDLLIISLSTLAALLGWWLDFHFYSSEPRRGNGALRPKLKLNGV